MIVEIAAREAITGLGLIHMSALQTFVLLLAQRDFLSPTEICTKYFARGEQLSAEEKLSIGVDPAAPLSRAAMHDLDTRGLTMPMQAHALTLARAIATIRRQRLVAELDADHSDGAPAIIHVAAHDACPKCAALDGVVTDQLGAWIFPPDDCRCAGAFGIELKALARNTR